MTKSKAVKLQKKVQKAREALVEMGFFHSCDSLACDALSTLPDSDRLDFGSCYRHGKSEIWLNPRTVDSVLACLGKLQTVFA